MDSIRVQTGEKDRIYVYALNSSASGVTGATISLNIKRQSDGFYWTGAGYTSAVTALTMNELDATNLPGIYYYDFRPTGPDANFVLRATTATAAVVNDPWIGEIKAGSWVDNIDAAITSRGSQTDLTEVLKRIGATIIELDLRRIVGLLDRVLAGIRGISK